uniref:Vasohibin n=1 Tax=Globisporangium ultimum (strain ATCC 200006 / CBS 805.95 / DAOM BR144) TaxID=431595 RepID=K3X8V2_GLOUD
MSAVTSEELQQAWQKVKHAKTLPDPPTIKLPLFSIKTPIKTRLIGIQHVINTLEYNYTGTQYFDVNKNRSFKSIVSTAKDIVNETLPIQCLEAVFLASYLTANASDLERFPISFKSIAGTNVHRHIILAVRYQHNKWGALGLSRSDKLMYKELKYASLSELIQDFCHEFELLYHRVLKVYVGFPFSHDIHSSEKVEWRVMNISLEFNEWTDAAQHFDSFAKDAVDILAYKKSKGVLPESFAAKFLLHTPESESGASKNAIKSPDKRRLTFSPSTFEFPPAGYEEDDAAADSLKAGEASPEKDLPKPILVAPDRLEFKPTLALRGNLRS